MKENAVLRKIPQVDELLKGLDESGALFGRTHFDATEAIREVLDELRAGIVQGEITEVPAADTILEMAGAKLKGKAWNEPAARYQCEPELFCITNLGRARMGEVAARAVMEAAQRYSTLEYDVEQGQRGSRYVHVEKLLAKLTGAEDALVVNNNAAALMLILNSVTTTKKEVAISRGELIEIGGSFRIPEIMKQSGSTLVEVGTTNKTHLFDYENAIGEDTAALLKVHTQQF